MCSVYSDQTMFVWDVSNIEKVSVKRSWLSHCSGPIEVDNL